MPDLDKTHPDYDHYAPDWRQLMDCYKGERTIKEAGSEYLPVPQSYVEDGWPTKNPGTRQYNAYKQRSVYPPFFIDAVDAMVGIIHQQKSSYEMPEAMEPLKVNATQKQGETLESLHRRITKHILMTGRLGLLVDLPAVESQDAMPYISLYEASDVANWAKSDRGVSFVVLREDGGELQEDTLEWKHKKKRRLCALDESGNYFQEFYVENQLMDEGRIEPILRGARLDEVPFVFVNPNDLSPEPDRPPLLSLSNMCLAIYRGEADYRQALYMQGQATLVRTGVSDADCNEDNQRVGAGALMNLPEGADAKYVGVPSAGLSEQRVSLENDRKQAAQSATQLVDTGRESGEALSIRVASRTASLGSIAQSSAMALQEALRIIARWMGQNEEDVIITPNMEFVSNTLTGQEALQFGELQNLGVISRQTLHDILNTRGVTSKSFEEEQEAIERDQQRGEVI